MMKIPNYDLRQYALKNRVRMWAVADAMGVSDNKLYRDLRKELDEKGKAEFRAIVDRLAQEGK
jgi:small-conductance mechanosensitive channel